MKTKRIFTLLLVLVSVVIAGFVAINIKNGLNAWQAEAQPTGGNILYVGGSGANNYTIISNSIKDVNGKNVMLKTNFGYWAIETIDSVSEIGSYTSIVLDSNYYPHIIYKDMSELESKLNKSKTWI